MPDRVTDVLTRPSVTADAIVAVLEEFWGVSGDLSDLPSERDRNFLVRVAGAPRYVLKFSNLAEDRSFVELQHDALGLLAAEGLPVQRLVRTRDGSAMAEADVDGGRALVRLLTWLPGAPLATLAPERRSPRLLEDLGRTMGRVASSLATLAHPAGRHEFQWDVLRFSDVVEAHAEAVADDARRDLLARARARLGESLVPVLAGLPRSLIHNDANDHNVLVDGAGYGVTGLLDLGDMVHSVTANEAAVAATYAMLGAAEPVEVLAHVVQGFHAERPLAPAEVAALSELVIARLCTSVVLSAHQARLDPTEPYLAISEEPAWTLLERLIQIEPAAVAEELRPALR
jgi:Ser/Thr protein kinase RdoA (MazF antagonist)